MRSVAPSPQFAAWSGCEILSGCQILALLCLQSSSICPGHLARPKGAPATWTIEAHVVIEAGARRGYPPVTPLPRPLPLAGP
jgi:hypothetical protein